MPIRIDKLVGITQAANANVKRKCHDQRCHEGEQRENLRSWKFPRFKCKEFE